MEFKVCALPATAQKKSASKIKALGIENMSTPNGKLRPIGYRLPRFWASLWGDLEGLLVAFVTCLVKLGHEW